MPQSEPGREPQTAHALLGLPPDAPAAALVGAYWRLRAHLERRLRESTGAEARRAELEALHAALLAAPGVDARRIPPLDGPAPRRSRRTAWLLAWATAATLAALVLAGLWIRDATGPTAGGSGDPAATADGPQPASLTVTADPASATLRVRTGEDDRVVVAAAADGTAVELEPGAYRLAVSHPDCPDAWSEAVELAAGEERAYAPRICRGEGRLVVRSNVVDDRVRIDGVDVGPTGAEAHALRTGRHTVQIDKQGYEPFTAEVRIEPGGALTLNAELAPAGEDGARSAERAAPPPETAATAPPAPRDAAAPDDAGADPGEPAPAVSMIDPTRGGEPLRVRVGKGGSKSWHDAIKQELVFRFDRNGSGSLDTAAEVEAVPCETWQEIEASYETGGLAVPMTHLYGFDGSEAPANTLGITNAVRSVAYARMKACGLAARR